MTQHPDPWRSLQRVLTSGAGGRSSQHLFRQSNRRLKVSRISIVDKPRPPASGDSHDYSSLGPYWWPDPATPDGLPYIRRDGEVNPETLVTDRNRLETFCDAVAWLILRAALTDSPRHAAHAGKLLRIWFLDPATRMNPHLRYAQAIPGRCEGRGIGLIDTVAFCFLLDWIERLPFNPFWTNEDMEALRLWFSHYLEWMRQSDAGRDECGEHNNHGTWYDAQVCRYALFCGQQTLARKHLEQHTFGRLSSQIEPDGAQPHELARTLSFNYATFNLLGFATLAESAEQVGLNLWEWQNPQGRGLLPAIHWMLPYYSGTKTWTWTQIDSSLPKTPACLLGKTFAATGERRLEKIVRPLTTHAWEKITWWKNPSERRPHLRCSGIKLQPASTRKKTT